MEVNAFIKEIKKGNNNNKYYHTQIQKKFEKVYFNKDDTRKEKTEKAIKAFLGKRNQRQELVTHF